MLRGKITALNADIRKEETSKTTTLSFYLRKLKREPKVNRREEIIRIREETSEIENRNSIEKISKTKSCFSETWMK